ncbi:uncharacterized protein LOC143806028 [Ranitomeya variabilis]|uniref:uncharacterized protein LOC143806028 n=1 Tax=Ranitomeya variabilis TaxID=490064 RepID=UPI004055CA79
MQIKGIFPVILFIFLRCHLGSALICYSCDGNCENNGTATCEQGQQCMTVEAYADGKLQSRQMGCQPTYYCTNNPGDSSIVRKCCDKDLCNDPRIVSASGPNPNNPGTSDIRDTPLECRFSDYLSVLSSKVTCATKEVCVTKSGKLALKTIHKQGCANSTVCGTQTSDIVMGTTISVMNTCCSTNLCNSAAHLEVPAVGILAAIVAAWLSKL